MLPKPRLVPNTPFRTISSKWLPKIFIQIFTEYLRAKLQAPVILLAGNWNFTPLRNAYDIKTVYPITKFKKKVKVSHTLMAVGAVVLEYRCILGTVDERRSPSLSFAALALPNSKTGTHLLLG